MDDSVFGGGRRAAILVTGATGFLGVAVAAELLTRGGSAELLFLVRAPDSRSGLQKLRDSVRGVSAANRRSDIAQQMEATRADERRYYFFFDNALTRSRASAAVYRPIGPVL